MSSVLSNRPIYLDYHATTPCDRRVVDAMLPYFCEMFGNPASQTHSFGWDAADAVQTAREQVARLLGASAKEVVFTSGGTEANNLAIQGVARANRDRGDQIITLATEHKSVIDTVRRLGNEGFRATILPVQPDGLVDLARLEEALDDRTILVSVMAANNEIGVLQPIREIVSIAHRHGALVHTDAVQAAGKVPFNVEELDVDLVSMSAHKIYGPKGVGALVVRRRKPPIALEPILHGGKHEHGLRSGTLNVPAIVGFGRAAEICGEELNGEIARLTALRDRLIARLLSVEGVSINGSLERRLPHNVNAAFEGVEPEALLMSLGNLAVSGGSACSSASAEPSHVLVALGLSDDLARASIRIGLGRYTTDDEADYAADKLVEVVDRLRKRSERLGIS